MTAFKQSQLSFERKEPWEDMELEYGGEGVAKGNGKTMK